MDPKVTHFEKNDRTYSRVEFESFDKLEEFFIENILGGDYKSKVIGTVLIFWSA